jgi:hypothetical protein
MSASFVFSSSKSSTYSDEYASGFDSPAASLDKLFKHPTSQEKTPEHFSCPVDYRTAAASDTYLTYTTPGKSFRSASPVTTSAS